jgi:hypothetical protein
MPQNWLEKGRSDGTRTRDVGPTTLGEGRSLRVRCRSETTGVTCVLVGGKNSGQGFFISRDVVKSIR